MGKRTRDRLITAGLCGAGIIAIVLFAEWRINVNHRLAVAVVEIETDAAETYAESESEETEAMPVIVVELPEITEAATETETDAETETAEPTTESPTSHKIAPTTPETILNDNFITETQPVPFQTFSLALTPDEEILLMRVASCEAGNQGWFGMALVMCVVLNRREVYGMSITDVIHAPRQFSVVGGNKWNSGFIADEAGIALQAIKDGWDGSQGALFFCAPRANKWHRSALTYLFTAGGHEFYK